MSNPLPAEHRAAATTLFGEQLELAVRYAQLLTTAGVERGLIGPREAPKIWDRHLLNCVVLGEFLPQDDTVIDVGSGAGLPGLVLAVARPDLRITLLEAQQRRARFLSEVVEGLGLSNVHVERGRAEERVGVISANTVTARAVAPLERLAAWCLPLLSPGGRLLAMKGDSAEEELRSAKPALRKLGVKSTRILQCGTAILDTPATVVELRK